MNLHATTPPLRSALCRVALTAALALSISSAAAAQTPPAVQAGFQDGFFIQSANGDNRLTLGLVAQVDGRFATDDPLPVINTFTLRKIRPSLAGQFSRYFTFKVMPDFGNGTLVMQDAYLDIRFSPAFRIRSGKDKVPIGYELLQGDGNLWFMERSLASSLVPNRDIGVQVQGDLEGGKVFYAAGLFNGIPDGTSSSTELDTNSSKDLAGRIVVQPFRSTSSPGTPGTPSGALNGFGFQLGASTGPQSGALPSFRTSAQQSYFSYVTGATAALTASANGTRTRVAPALFYYYKSFGTFVEYTRSAQPVVRNAVTTDVANHAWDWTGSFFLTGEPGTYGVVRPATPFDPPEGRFGALQLVARYSALSVDSAVFTVGLAAPTASQEAKSFGIGANWFPNQFVKFYASLERTAFSGGAARPVEHAILIRTQLVF